MVVMTAPGQGDNPAIPVVLVYHNFAVLLKRWVLVENVLDVLRVGAYPAVIPSGLVAAIIDVAVHGARYCADARDAAIRLVRVLVGTDL